MSAAAAQQQRAAGAEQEEEVEHGPFPIEQLQVRTTRPPADRNPCRFLGLLPAPPSAPEWGTSSPASLVGSA
jgi:hypothetical protein